MKQQQQQHLLTENILFFYIMKQSCTFCFWYKSLLPNFFSVQCPLFILFFLIFSFYDEFIAPKALTWKAMQVFLREICFVLLYENIKGSVKRSSSASSSPSSSSFRNSLQMCVVLLVFISNLLLKVVVYVVSNYFMKVIYLQREYFFKSLPPNSFWFKGI